ncbi:MAG: PAN/Apple domain-containing protein, partial [Pseudomonadota bacterium]
MAVQIGGWSADVSLRGSDQAVGTVATLCSRTPPRVSETIPFELRAERRLDEGSVYVEQGAPLASFSTHRGMGIWGGDLRTGLDDPSLQGIEENECARLCLSTEGCGAYTHNVADGKVCFLKTGAARMTAYQGATTGVLAKPPVAHVPPPTPGPLPFVDERVAWRDGEDGARHAQRIRTAAAPLGGSCQAERAALADLARTVRLELPGREATAGEPVRARWSGNTLAARIPAWIVTSSPAPIRFDGAAAMVLGTDAPNPFGMDVAAGETRAFVSLWARGAGERGHVDIRPLRAGPAPVTMRLVAWLRACNEEVVLAENRVALEIEPAPATLVMGTTAGLEDLTHTYDVPAHDRRITFGEDRFRLTRLSDGGEILIRDGRDLHLSPTGRFLLLDGAEVVDVADGATVARVSAASRWIAGDSFLMGHVAPWGSVDLASTFGSRLLIADQTTGPSCCDASPEMAHLALDLENGLLTLRGGLGHWIGPIQGGAYAREEAGNGYAAESHWTVPTQIVMMRGLGAVAPISVALGHSLPMSRSLGLPLREIATPLPASSSDEQIVVASLFRGTASEAVGAFERIGLRLSEGVRAK